MEPGCLSEYLRKRQLSHMGFFSGMEANLLLLAFIVFHISML